MSLDMSALHQVFFEESFEGLDTMESALLGLDLDSLDSETINEIFRAAHSIKMTHVHGSSEGSYEQMFIPLVLRQRFNQLNTFVKVYFCSR